MCGGAPQRHNATNATAPLPHAPLLAGPRQAFKPPPGQCRSVPKGPDPRKEAAPLAEVPRLLREGAAHYGERRFWHAHEAWESAWHALRAAGKADMAAYVRGMILVTAALENAVRKKEEGFKRQLAEGLHALLTSRPAAEALGVRDARAWEDALCLLYADACRRREWAWWNEGGWTAPPLALAEPGPE